MSWMQRDGRRLRPRNTKTTAVETRAARFPKSVTRARESGPDGMRRMTMTNAHYTEKKATPWWAAFGAPLVGVPLLVELNDSVPEQTPKILRRMVVATVFHLSNERELRTSELADKVHKICK